MASSRLTRKSQKFLEYIRQTYKCVKCGEDQACCLDFHHIDPKKKRVTLTTITNCTAAFIISEVERCALLCANCHRKIHANIISLCDQDSIKLTDNDITTANQLFDTKYGKSKTYRIKPLKSDLIKLIKKHNLNYIARMYHTHKGIVENWLIADNLMDS